MSVPTELAECITGRYQELRRVGGGAHGQVFRAIQPGAGAPVAIKWIPGTAQEANAAVREFAHLASVSHPNLVRVIEVLHHSLGTALVCAYVEGPPMLEYFASLAPAEQAPALIAFLSKAAAALEHLHQQGLVHGDVKPEQFLRSAEGEPILVDLGLVRPAGADDCRGTPTFMAP